MPYINLSDARIHYQQAGDSGSPVLLIMGFGVPGHMWMNQIPTLATRHRVVWFDNAGTGKTRRRRRLTMTTFGRHAASLMDHLGWDNAHVVGVSMGGMIAQELALSHQPRVRSLSLVATHAGGLRNLVPPPTSLALFTSGFLGPRRLRSRALERLIFPDAYLAQVDIKPLREALKDHVVEAARARERLAQVGAVLTHRAVSRLGRLASTPTLVVKASKDRLIRPRAADQLHARIPGSRLVEFEDAGHAILHQCADRLNRVLLDHFADADQRMPRLSA